MLNLRWINNFCGVVLTVFTVPAHAVFFGNAQGGTDFPQGAISFADAVVDYSPGLVGGNPSLPHRGPLAALGVPDYAGETGPCPSQADCKYVTLGDGGSLTLQFTDNLLTGSGNTQPDLWVFEIGPDVEDTFVELSIDGVTWLPVGKVFGSTASVDVDAFGFGPLSSFAYVRLTDDTNEGQQSGTTVGADIDSVGAISTVAIPLPAALWSLLSGLSLLGIRAACGRFKSSGAG